MDSCGKQYFLASHSPFTNHFLALIEIIPNWIRTMSSPTINLYWGWFIPLPHLQLFLCSKHENGDDPPYATAEPRAQQVRKRPVHKIIYYFVLSYIIIYIIIIYYIIYIIIIYYYILLLYIIIIIYYYY
jgi:hypothetical protein